MPIRSFFPLASDPALTLLCSEHVDANGLFENCYLPEAEVVVFMHAQKTGYRWAMFTTANAAAHLEDFETHVLTVPITRLAPVALNQCVGIRAYDRLDCLDLDLPQRLEGTIRLRLAGHDYRCQLHAEDARLIANPTANLGD